MFADSQTRRETKNRSDDGNKSKHRLVHVMCNVMEIKCTVDLFLFFISDTVARIPIRQFYSKLRLSCFQIAKEEKKRLKSEEIDWKIYFCWSVYRSLCSYETRVL